MIKSNEVEILAWAVWYFFLFFSLCETLKCSSHRPAIKAVNTKTMLQSANMKCQHLKSILHLNAPHIIIFILVLFPCVVSTQNCLSFSGLFSLFCLSVSLYLVLIFLFLFLILLLCFYINYCNNFNWSLDL